MSLALKYAFAEALSLAGNPGPTLALTRTTTASVTDYNNIIKTVASGEERYTGGRRVENLVLTSLDAGSWSKNQNGGDKVTGQPDVRGGTEAVTCPDDGSTGTGTNRFLISTGSVVGFTAGHKYTFSAEFKLRPDATFNWMVLRPSFIDQTPTGDSWFDLDAGVIDESTSEHSPTMEDLGDGWYRCSTTFTTGADVTGQAMNSYMASGAGSITSVCPLTGDEGYFIARIQIEDVSGQDDPAPSEYQETNGAAVSKWYATKRRTNLLLASNDLDVDAGGEAWGASVNSTVEESSDFPAGVDGITKSWYVKADGTNTQHTRGQNANNSPFFNAACTVAAGVHKFISTVYAKKGPVYDHIMVQSLTGGNHNRSAVDLNDGTISEEYAQHDVEVSDAGNGWWRISWKWAPSLGFTGWYNTAMVHDGVSASAIFSGDGTGIYMAGMQCETGIASTPGSGTAATPTAYIHNDSVLAPASSGFDTDITVTGLLVEEARTNICLQSEDFSTTWATGGTSVINTDQLIAPDGTLTADELVDDGSTGSGTVSVTQNITAGSAVSHAYSIYLKAGVKDWAFVALGGFTGKSISAYFDLTDGALGATTGADNEDEIIEDVGNGWYRCTIVGTPDGGDLVGQVQVWVADGNNDITLADLDGTNNIYVWGGQFEAGAFPTTYIPTVASSVTRNADDIVTTDVSWWDDAVTGITWYAHAQEYETPAGAGPPSITGYVFELGTNEDNHIYVRSEYDNRTGLRLEEGSTAHVNTSNAGGDIGDGTEFRFAWGYDATQSKFFIDGADSHTDNSTGGTPNNPQELQVGRRNNALEYWNGHIAEIRYYNTKLTDQQLEDLSNGIFPVELRHKDAALRHNTQTLRHKDTTIQHNDTTLEHQGG